MPFELPEGWAWSRFGAYTVNRDSERKPVSSANRATVAKIYDYYGASGTIDKVDGFLFNEQLLLIGEDGANLVTRSKPIAFFADGQYWVNNHAHCIDAIDKTLLGYICIYINAINLEPYVTGSAQPKMTQDKMNSILVPVPPYTEQLKICKKLQVAFDCIDNIEADKEDIGELILNTKSRILDLAIRGKLVPQDPNDEPASVLLERIRAEKEELIKQGKIKRDKKESVIFKGEDNSYYGIRLPGNWDVATLKSISASIRDGSHNPPPNSGSGIPILSASNIYDNKINIDSASRWLTEENWVKENKRTNLEVNDILLTIIGSIGRAAIIEECSKFALQRSVAVIKPILVYPEYLMFYLESPRLRSFLNENSKGTAQKGIYLNSLSEMVVFIPPLSEQKKIVKTIKSCFTILDKIIDTLA